MIRRRMRQQDRVDLEGTWSYMRSLCILFDLTLERIDEILLGAHQARLGMVAGDDMVQLLLQLIAAHSQLSGLLLQLIATQNELSDLLLQSIAKGCETSCLAFVTLHYALEANDFILPGFRVRLKAIQQGPVVEGE